MSRKDKFFQRMEALGLALTYDDVRLKTGYSEVDPQSVSTKTRFSRNIQVSIPIASAAMDTVTESKMAIAMAKNGGIGIIHRALTPEEQSSQVRRVKLHLNCRIDRPIAVRKTDTIEQINNRREQKGYSFQSFPVIDENGRLVGLLTRNDFDLAPSDGLMAEAIMTPLSELTTGSMTITKDQAYEILQNARKKILPLMNEDGQLTAMYVFSDLKRIKTGEHSNYNIDAHGHLIVGAAIGTGAHELIRAELLLAAGCDVLIIDTAHGDSRNVIETLHTLKRSVSCDIVVGNVSEAESAKRLVEVGADGIKVGQGGGSICTTRIVAGVGCPQVTAIYNCAQSIQGLEVPICADGGIQNSGDITIALGAGADSVMIGNRFAGTTESPGEIRETKNGKLKYYRGMGSAAAMQSSQAARERYRQSDASFNKLVPEGIESWVHYQGDVADVLKKYVGGLRSGMGYVGATSIGELQEKADFHRISLAGLKESHPHDVMVIENTR